MPAWGSIATCPPPRAFPPRPPNSPFNGPSFASTRGYNQGFSELSPGEITVQGDARILEFLNQALKNELTSINQYFVHARMLDNWGMKRLGKIEYQESIDEMKHADRLVKRILFLQGLPNLQDLGKLFIGENVREVLECDLRREMEAHPLYIDAIAHCETVKDYVTRDLLVYIQKSEEEHIDFIEEQLGLIDKMGVPNYIQSATGELGESTG
jgi:bacterioferritin